MCGLFITSNVAGNTLAYCYFTFFPRHSRPDWDLLRGETVRSDVSPGPSSSFGEEQDGAGYPGKYLVQNHSARREVPGTGPGEAVCGLHEESHRAFKDVKRAGPGPGLGILLVKKTSRWPRVNCKCDAE